MKKLAKRKVSKIKQKPVKRRNPVSSRKEVEKAIEDLLLYPYDGPATYYVVLVRALELSAKHKYNPEILSSAVYDIIDINWMKVLSYSNSWKVVLFVK